jgi:DNA repair ATPase RecN
MEDSNNQSAPEAIATDNAAATTDSTNAADSQNVDQSTTPNPTSPAQPAFDPRTSYDALVKQLEAVNKNYGNLRSEYTRRTQHESAMKQQIDSLHKAFEEATRQEISPEEFIKSLQTQGIKAFDPLKTQWTKELQEGHNKALQERDQNINALNVKVAVMVRKSDTENYPDFAKLMPVMNEIASSDNCPVDWNQDVDVIYDTLYKLARDVKAEESVKQAHALGRKEADAQSAKEASTAVAAGGKTNTAGLDPRNMSAGDLKKHFAKLGMISD